MLMSRALWVPIAAATVLVGLLLSAPAFAQAHIRGTLTAASQLAAPANLNIRVFTQSGPI